jgi:sporulation protein YlmC with PRC-barrel domain
VTLPDIDTVLEWRGRTIVDRAGEKIGKFQEIYLDTETDRPEWAAVSTGLLGRRQRLIPLSEAQPEGDDVRVPFDKEHVENAPEVDSDRDLSQDEEARLYAHYGVEYSKGESGTGLPRRTGSESAGPAGQPAGAGTQAEPAAAGAQPEPAGAGAHGQQPGGAGVEQPSAAPGRAAPAAGEEVVDDLGAEVGPRERVRLKKYIVTEQVTKTVPVTREEVRVEREPVSDE